MMGLLRCLLLGMAGIMWSLPGCSYAVGDGRDPASAASAQSEREAPVDDGARCEFKGRDDREVAESVGTGALQPSIRRVYRVVGQGSHRRRVIVCREVDTNLDGKKDVVRRYTDQGDPIEERADTNHDGVLDRSMRFTRGKVTQIEIDQNQDDKPEETRYYQNGKLSRVQRDTNADGKPDIWEIYAGGHLDRMGVDVDYDGRVDRWNRDEVMLRAQRAAEEAEPANASPAGEREQRSAPEGPTGARPQQAVRAASGPPQPPSAPPPGQPGAPAGQRESNAPAEPSEPAERSEPSEAQ